MFIFLPVHFVTLSVLTAILAPKGGGADIVKTFMSYELFEKIVNQISEFPQRIKLLNFAWLGEPLLHPDISKMVAYAKKRNIADRVEIVSNASRLTPELSENLVDAGLDRIRISIQGLSQEDYYNISKYKLDYKGFVKNIEYLHNYSQKNGGHTKIYIKIMDAMLKEEGAEEKFRSMFEPICDMINIETLVPLVSGLDISNLKTQFEKGYWNENLVSEPIICPQPFYLLVITPEGKVLSCCEVDGEHMVVGNVLENSLTEIWNGSELRALRRKMICGKRKDIKACAECNVIKYQTNTLDLLDQYVEQLKVIY